MLYAGETKHQNQPREDQEKRSENHLSIGTKENKEVYRPQAWKQQKNTQIWKQISGKEEHHSKDCIISQY